MSEVPGQSGLALLIYMALIAPFDFRVPAGLLRSSLPVDCDPSRGFLPPTAGQLEGSLRPG